jgi:hypothetical protein
MMDDHFGVRTVGGLQVTCQIIHVGHRDGATLIDLVTLAPCERGETQLPAGTPLTVGFESRYMHEDRMALENVVGGWETSDAVLLLEVADLAGGICYQFTDGEEQLLLVLGELPPGP